MESTLVLQRPLGDCGHLDVVKYKFQHFNATSILVLPKTLETSRGIVMTVHGVTYHSCGDMFVDSRPCDLEPCALPRPHSVSLSRVLLSNVVFVRTALDMFCLQK